MRINIRAVLALAFSLTTAATAQTYFVTNHWSIGGQGGWDYLLSDDSAHRLYIAHNSRLEVLDTQTGKPIGAVTGLKGIHGVALNPDSNIGYISDGAANAIVLFNRDTFSITSTIPAGTGPDAITFEPITKTVWAFNGHSQNASVLDTSSNTIVATVALPGRPEYSLADDEGNILLNIEDKNAIVKLNAQSKKIVATWVLTGCESPSGMAIDRIKHRVFSVCDGNKMAIVDYTSGKLLGLATIGNSPDAAGFDPKSGQAFSSNGGDGTVSVIDTTRPGFPTIQTVKTAKGARTMALDATTGRIFLAAAKYGLAPLPTASTPHPRPPILPDSLEIIVLEK